MHKPFEPHELIQAWIAEQAPAALGMRPACAFKFEFAIGQLAIAMIWRDENGIQIGYHADGNKSNVMVGPGGTKCTVTPGPARAMFLASDMELEDDSEDLEAMERDLDKVMPLVHEGMSQDEAQAGIDAAQNAIFALIDKPSTQAPKKPGRPSSASTQAPAATGAPKRKMTVRAANDPVELIRAKLMRLVGITELPPLEQMFEKIINRPNIKWVKPSELACFCHSGSFDELTTDIGRAMHTVGNAFACRNICNPHAEVKPDRVLQVAMQLLKHGHMWMPMEVCSIKDIPQVILDDVEDPINPDVHQIWTGRHRGASLVLLYGPDISIPVLPHELSYQDALDACLVANDTRALGQEEKVYHAGREAEVQFGTPASAFLSFNGKATKLREWVSYQTTMSTNPDFVKATAKIVDKKATYYSITMGCYRELLKEAWIVMSNHNEHIKKSYKDAAKFFNLVISTVDATFDAFYKKREITPLALNTWTSYSSGAYGRFIGKAILAAQIRGEKFDPVAYAEELSTAVLYFLRYTEGAGKKLANTHIPDLSHALNEAAEAAGVELQ